MESLGLFFALGAALCWGSYMVPFKSSSFSPILYQAVMGVGVLISGLVLTLLMGYSFELNVYGLMCGVLWAVANIIFISAITNLGLSKAIPITSSLVILTSFIWGSLVFKELETGLVIAILSISLIILGVLLVGSIGHSQTQSMKKGLLSAILSGIIFGSQFTPVQIAKVNTSHFFFAMSVGVFITTLLILIIKKSQPIKLSKEGLLSGAGWNLGNLFGALAISMIGLSKGLPITQLSVVVGVSWGILYFKEVKGKKQIIQIVLGTTIFLIGVGLLSLA